jgi:hypothetical protein
MKAVTFLKKSNQKTFDSLGGVVRPVSAMRGTRMAETGLTTPPKESKVFARFFQKALLSSLSVNYP